MLGVPNFAKATWITRLAGMPIVHKVIRAFRIQQVASRALGVIPVKRSLRRSGCEYRVRFLESFLTADEIFDREIYRDAFEDLDVRTFMDLGSNVGYFSLYAAENTGRKDLLGIAVDGNEEMARESRWHVEHNALAGTRALHGVVGFPADVTEATFFVNPSNVASSAQPVLNPNVPSKGDSVPMKVPAVNLMREWRELAGDRRLNLLKVDVEGFECELIKNCSDLIEITDRIVIEWHKWVTTHEEVDGLLVERGLQLRKIITEDQHAGVAIYDRKPVAQA
jgi:FkbM family methyltransferase